MKYLVVVGPRCVCCRQYLSRLRYANICYSDPSLVDLSSAYHFVDSYDHLGGHVALQKLIEQLQY